MVRLASKKSLKVSNKSVVIKFGYSEKATKFEKNFLLSNVKFSVEDFFKFRGLLKISELYYIMSNRW